MVEEQDDGTWVEPTTSDFLTLDGTEVHVVSWQPTGGAAMAPPLLLVHGLGGSTVLWERVAGKLAERLGAEVVGLDLPGFGRSRARRLGTAIADSARVVGALLRRLGPCRVLGSSMGAAVAVRSAAFAPELVHSLGLIGAALPLPSPFASPGSLSNRVSIAALPGIGPLAVWGYARFLTAEQIVDDRLTECPNCFVEAVAPHLERTPPS